MTTFEIPAALVESHTRHGRDEGHAWIAALPDLVARTLKRWRLHPDGPPAHGCVALVLPVIGASGQRAALKFQPVNDENEGEPIALTIWNGDGAVRLLDQDPETGTLLLERLDASRPLSAMMDDDAAVQILAELLGRLVSHPAPSGLRHLADIAAAMIEQLPHVLPAVPDREVQELLTDCAGAVKELLGEPGDRLLHWDLHYDNVLASHSGAAREPWLAIDPKPLAGHPGFDLWPALDNRWESVVATGDIPRAIRRRFDRLIEVLGLDRQRARGWTLGRLLQNALWNIEDGDPVLPPEQVAIARAIF